MVEYLHISCTHTHSYVRSSLQYLQCLTQCKCYVNSCLCTKFKFCFLWTFRQFETWIHGWLNLQMQNPQIQRGDCSSLLSILQKHWPTVYWGKTTDPLPQVVGEAMKQFSNSRPGIWPVQCNSRDYSCPQDWKTTATPPGSVSAFQGAGREGKGQKAQGS